MPESVKEYLNHSVRISLAPPQKTSENLENLAEGHFYW